jgi:hypothetical protein
MNGVINVSIESWFLLFLGFLLSLISTYYFYRKGKREPIGCYSVKGLNVIDIEESSVIGNKVVVSYDSEPLSRLSVGVVTFWNGGTSILEGSALIQRDPLRIGVNSNGKILEAIVIANPNPQCDCRIKFGPEVAPNNVLISFDFLDQQNGVTVRILHTAVDDTLEVLGTLKGVRLEHQWQVNQTYDRIWTAITYVSNGAFAVFLITIASTLSFDQLFGIPAFVLTIIWKFVKVVGGLCCVLLICGLPLDYLRRKATHKIPAKLENS